MIAYLKQALLSPVYRHPAKAWYEWQTPFDPQLSELKDYEHGIYRQISGEMIHANGLVLSYDGDGAINVRVN